MYSPCGGTGRRGRLKIYCPYGRGSSSLPGGTKKLLRNKMARRCTVTGRGVMVGNNVSHANNKTKRRFLPNMQKATLISETLGETIKVRITPKGLRTVEFKGGLDAYLLSTPNSRLNKVFANLKKRLEASKQSA